MSLALLVLVGVVSVSAASAGAEEWKIFLLGRTEPIVADSYVEDPPWVFFHDDQSMYVFAIGCNRIDRVERAGAEATRPTCPVDKLPTTMPRVYIAIMDLEAKRLDDSISKLREQTRAYSEAIVGSAIAARGQAAAGQTIQAVQATFAQNVEGIAFLASQISDTLFDIRLSERRVGRLLDALKTYPPGARQRYFFFTR